MKKIFKIIGICFLTCFSFYYTDKIIDLSKKKDPIMKEIVKYSKEHNTMPVSAIINDNYLESGYIGYTVDIDKSYQRMKKLGKFDESLIIYKENYPDNTIKDNYDKYIIKSNTNNYLISLIIIMENNDNLDEILGILKDNDIITTFFVKNLDSSLEKISNLGHNIGIMNNNVKHDLNIINKYNNNNTYCYLTEEDKDFIENCSKLKLNTILSNKINKNLYHEVKENLNKGTIFSITNSSSNVKMLDTSIKYIKQKGYDIIDIDKLLNES